jgi:hypothetical protein
MFRLHKNVFKKQSFNEADNQKTYWLSKSADERIHAAIYLQSVVYGFDLANLPRMDKTVFSKRKQAA